MTKKQLLVSAALTGLCLAGAVGCATDSKAAAGKCYGINGCKGKGDCGGKHHSCSGQNKCKGKGWKKMDKSSCVGKGGKFVAKR